MKERPEWGEYYWEYINQHDPIMGENRSEGDRCKSATQVANEAAEYADRETKDKDVRKYFS